MKKFTGQRLELLIFTLVTLFNLYPFIALRFFPTLDGASHMSNASIISQIVVYHNELIRQFFMINPEPVPNWTTHMLLSITGLVLPAFLAEKVLLLLLLAGTPFAFRRLVRTIAPNNYFYSYFIFPFTQSMFFYFGFYNFCIAILLFFITLTFWLRHFDRMNLPWNQIRLGGLILITWFSHILVFGALMVVIATYIITFAVHNAFIEKTGFKGAASSLFSNVKRLLLSAFLPLLLFFYFFLSRPSTTDVIFIPFKTLVNNLINIQSLIVFNGETEGSFTRILLLLILVLAVIAFGSWIVKLFLKSRKTAAPVDGKTAPGLLSAWLILSIILLACLYFTLPDAVGEASYTTYRLGFIIMLLAILAIASSPIHLLTGLVAGIAVLYINFSLIHLKQTKVKELEVMAIACNKASDFVKPNSVVLPIYCMDNWFTGHFVDYIAIDKPMVMLYNYECETGFFPVKNNLADKPNYYLGNPGLHKRLIRFEWARGRSFRKIDYVFLVGGCNTGNTDNWEKIEHILGLDFTVAYKTDYCTLYRKK